MNDRNLKAHPTATAGQTGEQLEPANYDAANISDIRKAWETERSNGTISHQAYTMVQANAPYNVEITEESRKACVDALMR